ncbi:MAG TPA: hypothetical protein VMC10_13410 [Stellaceae bacterium]|nr:hypothetical protein [Stellaceae bacterium]
MQYYLVRLSYTATAWQQLIDRTTSLDERLGSVRKLIAQLGGSLANFHFFDDQYFRGIAKRTVVTHKFMPFGEHDIVTILALPDPIAARSFQMAVAAEDGVKGIELLPMISLEEGVKAMGVAKAARRKTAYVAPGGQARRRK